MQIVYEGIEGNGEIYLDVLKAICGDTEGKSMVDLMCHKAPYTPQLGFSDRTYVDIQDRPLDFPEEQRYFIRTHVISYLFNLYEMKDVMICSDGIEHLYRSEGPKLLWHMKMKSRKAIIFTPLGDLNITRDTHPDAHKSGYIPEDLQEWAFVIFPNFHPKLSCGAFFAWYHLNLQDDFERVKQELNNKSWTKLNK